MRPAQPPIKSLRIDWLSQTNFPLVPGGDLRRAGGRSWHERDAFAGRPKNVLVVPVVSSFVWIAAACCCALRRRRQQRRLSGKGF